jgi:hypothetical protein
MRPVTKYRPYLFVLLAFGIFWILFGLRDVSEEPRSICETPKPNPISNNNEHLSKKQSWFNVVMNKNFKWNFNVPMWAGVFGGTNDPIQLLDALAEQLKSLRRSEVEFLTVVGGMKHLHFLERIDFGRVSFFDGNINEVTKMSYVLDYLNSTSYSDFKGFGPVVDRIREDPEEFFLPHPLRQAGVQFNIQNDFHFEHLGKSTDMFVFLPPDVYPSMDWKPISEAGYKRALDNLFNYRNKDFVLHFPYNHDAQGRVIVLFLSHIEAITVDIIKAGIKNSPLVLPVFADNLKTKTVQELNQFLVNPHPYWQLMIDLYKKGKSLQVWAPEDKSLIGGQYDKGYTRGVLVTKYITETDSTTYDSIIIHILYGKMGGIACDREARSELFRESLLRSKQVGKRIIVSDHNKESGQFDDKKCLPTSQELIEQCRSILEPEFSINDIRYSAGEKKWNRNIFIIADKV